MSERGVFAVDRGIWEHDALISADPFSRREAWLWLVSEAAWKPHRRRLAGRTIDVERGQLAASLRFIASKWRWSEPRVRRFLAVLISDGMIIAQTDARVTVLTICNYNTYQRVSLPNDSTDESNSDAEATQERRKVEDKEYKEEEESSLRSDSRARKRATRLPDDWQPSEADLAAAAARGLIDRDLRSEIEKFRNYWHAKGGKDAAKRDWSATWRNWVITWSERHGRGNGQGNRGSRSTNESAVLTGISRAFGFRGGEPPRPADAEIPRGRIELDIAATKRG